MIKISDFWLGTEASLQQVLTAIELYQQNPALYPPKLYIEDDEDEDEDAEDRELIQVEDGIGFMLVDGPLTAQESWLDRYFGITSYPMIARNAKQLVEMHADGEINRIVHVWNSPGGDASGINGLTEVLAAAKEAVPDTVSYTSGMALSAGYWLAAVNDTLRVDKMAEVGSIGVISTIRSYARRLKEEGIDVKVVRSGQFKALLHPAEPISEQGLREVEQKGEELHQFFIDHIQSRRPALRGGRQAWGEGQTFFGEKAIEIGLADGPATTLNALVNQWKVRDNTRNNRTYSFSTQPTSRGNDMTKQVHFPSEAEQAAVASGVDLSAVPHEEVEVPEVPPVVEVKAEGSEPPAQPEPESMTAYLTAELKAVRGELDELRVKLGLAEQERVKLAAAEEQLAPIVREATNKLQIALRQTPTNLTGLPASVLAAHYAEIKAQFEKVMPVGAHARSETDTSREPQDAGEQRLFLIK
jgi:ClpP class serine protease